MFRKLASAALASALLLSSTAAFAASDSNQAALAPGKPAGVKEAQMFAPTWIWVAGIGVIALGVVLVASGGNNGTSTTTTSTNP
jgi:hypothetical protein